jgi:hypothetical protein
MAVAAKWMTKTGKHSRVEHLGAKNRNAASMGILFTSYDVNSGFGGDKSQHAP